MSPGRCCVFVFALCVVAFANAASEESDSRALIRQLNERIVLEEKISGSFRQEKYISVLPDALESHGSFTYDHEAGLMWETLAPISNRLVFDKQGIRQSMDGETVWEIDAQQPAVVTITQVISSVLAADWATLQEYFSIDGNIDAAGWQLQLKPRDEVLEQVVSSISVSGDRVLEAMTLVESNGDRSEIAFVMQVQPQQQAN